MALGNIIPKKSSELSLRKGFEYPFEALHREMDRLFDNFSRGNEIEPLGWLSLRETGFSPKVNVTEDDQSIRVTAELPGMDEKDIEVTVGRDSLTLKGEKKSEREEKGKGYYRMERSFGSFARTIPLSAEIDEEKVDAKFSKGVLTIRLPKTIEAQSAYRKIEVKGE
jgi:HSP20 family protein